MGKQIQHKLSRKAVKTFNTAVQQRINPITDLILLIPLSILGLAVLGY